MGWFGSRKNDTLLAAADYTADDDALSPQELEHKLGLRLAAQALRLRERYGSVLLWLVVGQVVVINALLIFVGTGSLHLSDELFKTFSISVFVEVVALAMVVTRSLFPSRRGPVEELAEALKSRHSDET